MTAPAPLPTPASTSMAPARYSGGTMPLHVTVVPADRLIMVDGLALRLDFTAPETLHALQWHGSAGHMEWIDDLNHPLLLEDYEADVAPFVTLWEAEKERLERVAAEAETARLAAYNSLEARAERVRVERDKRISATDYLMAQDYPLSEDERELWRAYRQALRDVPAQEGFPWAGGGADDPDCPWPLKPGEAG